MKLSSPCKQVYTGSEQRRLLIKGCFSFVDVTRNLSRIFSVSCYLTKKHYVCCVETPTQYAVRPCRTQYDFWYVRRNSVLYVNCQY